MPDWYVYFAEGCWPPLSWAAWRSSQRHIQTSLSFCPGHQVNPHHKAVKLRTLLELAICSVAKTFLVLSAKTSFLQMCTATSMFILYICLLESKTTLHHYLPILARVAWLPRLSGHTLPECHPNVEPHCVCRSPMGSHKLHCVVDIEHLREDGLWCCTLWEVSFFTE